MVMRLAPLWFALVCLVAGCRSGIDCGTYVFDETRQICVCPAGTVELPGGGCVGVDGGLSDSGGLDSAVLDSGSSDAGQADADGSSMSDPDAGECSPTAEVCNGVDDDCDGRLDEELVAVSPETTLSAGNFRSPHIIGQPEGFGVVYASVFSPPTFAWRTVSELGVPASSPHALGADLQPESASGFSVSFDGTNVVLAYPGISDFQVVAFAPVDGTRRWGPFPLPRPSGRIPNAAIRIAAASLGRVTVYAEFIDTTTGAASLRRFRIDSSGAAPSIVHESSVPRSLDAISAWDVLTVGSNDIVAFRSSGGDIDIIPGAAGDETGGFGTSFTLRTAVQEPNVTAVAIAVRDPRASLGTGNPLGIAWQRSLGGGTGFVQLASLSASGVGMATSLPGSGGPLNDSGSLQLVAAPTGSVGSLTGHWLVAGADDDAASTDYTGFLRVWEVIGDGAVARALTLPGEVSAPRADISIAVSGSAVSVAEENATRSIVTRQIGCL